MHESLLIDFVANSTATACVRFLLPALLLRHIDTRIHTEIIAAISYLTPSSNTTMLHSVAVPNLAEVLYNRSQESESITGVNNHDNRFQESGSIVGSTNRDNRDQESSSRILNVCDSL